jgi:hypothetical protein
VTVSSGRPPLTPPSRYVVSPIVATAASVIGSGSVPTRETLAVHDTVVFAEVAAAARTGADSQGVHRFCVG